MKMKELGNVFIGRESDQRQDMRPERGVHSDGPVFLSNGRHWIFSPMFRSPGLTTEAALAGSRAPHTDISDYFPKAGSEDLGGPWAAGPGVRIRLIFRISL